MKLHENQLHLIRHLCRFHMLNYADCLWLLDTEETNDPTALSYVFRPLTKNGYLSKRKDGSVTISAKGRALFPDTQPLISVGGGEKERQRLMTVSRVAALLARQGIPSSSALLSRQEPYFIPSACWRKIAPGILSTTRFAGMLMLDGQKLAVYDIGDGSMEWQVRAEGSLFYTRYGRYETKADGMILICLDENRNAAAKNIIRQTMWSRRQLLSAHCAERNRPTCWSRSPIKLRVQYERVYLTTPKQFKEDISRIICEPGLIQKLAKAETILHDPVQGDYEAWPCRYYINTATDLLKYVFFFSEVKELLAMRADPTMPKTELRYGILSRKKDFPILRMYPDVLEMEGLKIYVYRSEEDTDAY